MPGPINPYLAKAFDLSTVEVPKSLESRMFCVTYPDARRVYILGTTHVLPISSLSKQEILAIDECSFFIGEEAEFDPADSALVYEQGKKFFREEKDTWYDEVDPTVFEAITCLWNEIIAPQFMTSEEITDIRVFNREAASEYLSFCIYDLIDTLPEIQKSLEEASDGMDLELENYVFSGRTLAFDKYMERKLRVYATENLPDSYLEMNKFTQEDKMSYLLFAAHELTSFKVPDGYDFPFTSEVFSLEEVRNVVSKQILEIIFTTGGNYRISDILENEEEDVEEDLLDMRKCNMKWSAQLHSMIKDNDGIGLVGVGRGHLFGEYGMLTLLQREHGCKIEVTSPSGWLPWYNAHMQYLKSYRMIRREILEAPLFVAAGTLPLFHHHSQTQISIGVKSSASLPVIAADEGVREVIFASVSEDDAVTPLNSCMPRNTN